MYSNPTITIKVTRKVYIGWKCTACHETVQCKQSRIYNKQDCNYTCYNFYKCNSCGYEYKEQPRIIAEYEVYPRLDADSYEYRECTTELPVLMGDNITNVEVVGINLK
jgi:hypothetical protein